jgi:polyhydroxybutyrate depolymerase
MRMVLSGWLAWMLVGCTSAPSDDKTSDPDTLGSETDAPVSETDLPEPLSEGANELIHDGEARRFFLHLPPGDVQGAPLLIAMHGYSSNASFLRAYSDLDDAADEHGFVVVYPEGTEDADGYRYWEVGYAFHDGAVDDVGFLRELTDRIVTELGLSAEHVFTTGMSNGADMSYMLACTADDLIAGIAPVAGIMMTAWAETCAPADPVPVLAIHGTDDSVSPWDGDPNGLGGWGPFWSVNQAMTFWQEQHRAYDLEQADLPDLDQTDDSTVKSFHWTSDAHEEDIWLYRVENGGHDWPGSEGANQDISSADLIGAFVSRVAALP